MRSVLRQVDGLTVAAMQLAQLSFAPTLRYSLGLILLWIGALKFHDASPVVGLIHASLFSPLATVTFVHALGSLEILAALLMFSGVGLRYAGLLSLLLFVSTLTIFFTTPSVTGLPYLTLAGQFLLKDLVLAAASLAVVAQDATQRATQRAAAPSRMGTVSAQA